MGQSGGLQIPPNCAAKQNIFVHTEVLDCFVAQFGEIASLPVLPSRRRSLDVELRGNLK